jgi:NAD(P)-dependent dehydrogenase (short-subunit alcohol dehydrogenase family)
MTAGKTATGKGTNQNLFSVAGKVAVVTGGSRGIGLMIARGFVEAGVKVYICSRKKETCDRAAAELSKIGPCFPIPADLGSGAGVKELVEAVKAREPVLHILVNNAGATWGAPLGEYPEIAWDKLQALNVKAMFLLTQGLLPLLEKGARPLDPARVINIGSIDGLKVPHFENYAYAATKAGVHHLTRVLAQNLGKRGITVNAIAPGPFESKMWDFKGADKIMDEVRGLCPLGRIGTPEDMAGLTIFLSSRAGAYVNGAVIPLDGGLVTKP